MASPIEVPPSNGRSKLAYAIVALTLLAPALAGSTQLWAQAVLATLTGFLFFLFPPRKALGQLPNLAFAALFLLGLSGFLPASWFRMPAWRSAILELGARLPDTLSGQPLLTLEANCSLLLGLAWAYYLLTFEWTRRAREKTAELFCFGILVLAATLTIAFALHTRVPFWPKVPEFGFFPNRNQTSNVLGLAGILIYAIGLQRFQQGRRDWWLWLASLSLICWALILNYSRAGIVLFFSGALAWHVWWLAASKLKGRSLVMVAALAFFVGILLFNGGTTLERFAARNLEVFSSGPPGRFAIYRDTLHVIHEMPLFGSGLGNFPAMFALDRNYSAAANEAIHPESDWLWVAVELGWLGPALLLVLFVWWLKRCLPFNVGTARGLRCAALICGCGFAVHGLFDVSAHRIGALWPALLLAALAVHPEEKLQASRTTPWLFRAIGLILIAMGLWWFFSVKGTESLPTSADLARLRNELSQAIDNDDYKKALQLASAGLRIAPLDWKLYYNRATAEAALISPPADAVRDFRIARFLIPYWPEVCLQEGEIWLAVGETDLAFDAWTEALRRSPQRAPQLYGAIYGAVKSDVTLRDRWRQLAQGNPKCLLVFLQNADPVEFQIEFNQMLQDDPELRQFGSDELKRIFSVWYEKGDKLALAETLQQHPAWQKVAWRELARAYADYEDYRPAYETAVRFAPPPRLPQIDSQPSIESLARRFRATGDIKNDGLALALAELNRGQIDDALATLTILSAKSPVPKPILYLESDVFARKGNWQKAWQAMWQYLN